MTDQRDDVAADPTRRRLLTGLGLGGAAVVGGIVGGVGTAAATGPAWRRDELVLEVACLGHKWREIPAANPASASDFRYAFSVEGWIYPEGTIPGDGFLPTVEGSIGTWFCKGWIIIDADRSEPHVLSTQDYVLGPILPDSLFPPDSLASSGTEGTVTDQVGIRAVTGGTGAYLAAHGAVTQANHGVNTTVLADGLGDPAPNFRFTFDLLLPRL